MCVNRYIKFSYFWSVQVNFVFGQTESRKLSNFKFIYFTSLAFFKTGWERLKSAPVKSSRFLLQGTIEKTKGYPFRLSRRYHRIVVAFSFNTSELTGCPTKFHVVPNLLAPSGPVVNADFQV